jgi:ATP-dependent helicase/nuclease subunit A
MSAPAIHGLVDGAARQAIREGLERTLIVEAAAGTGKTTELVQRIVGIVASGRGKLSSIVAVTFTEKAAGEMKLRIRTELDGALSEPGRAGDELARIRHALSELEAARIGTIHGLCSDLLRAHPVEAGVDPAFEVLDAARSRALLERAFGRWFEAAVEQPPEGVRRVLARKQENERGKSAREALLGAVANLVDTRDFDTPYRREPFDRDGQLERSLQVLDELSVLGAKGSHNDPLARALRALHGKLQRARKLGRDAQEEWLRKLAHDRSFRSELRGKKGRGDAFSSNLSRADVVARRDAVAAELLVFAEAAGADLAACLSRELTPAVAAYQEEKARLGALDFFDLLLFTRRMIADVVSVRAALQSRITHLFVDEFQDTDPVQAEILMLLAADASQESDPWQARTIPGKLFLVGDPKQSIYRFRRADVLLYERVKRHLLAQGAELVQLSTSFRSLPGIQQCVNAAFAPLMDADAGRGQAAYVPLAPFRAARGDQPAVVALPVPEPYGGFGRVTQKEINRSLPDAVAAWIDWLLTRSGYRVLEAGRDVPVEARHVCLLFKRFKSYDDDVTREYVRALEARRVPHVLSGGRSFHAREEVIALRAALTAVEWPDDGLHVYATLRGPFVALSDETLLSFKRTVGHLHPLGPVDVATLSPAEQEVSAVLTMLGKLHRGRNRRPIASTLQDLLETLRAHAGIAIWPTGEQALGNVLRVLDFARAHERRGGVSSFRGFVEWLERQAELAEAPEAPVIEEGSDGVRIMTVHTAKGLEFPIVILCDPTAPRRSQRASRFVDGERRLWAQTLCEVEPWELAEHREQVRDQDESEVVRLSYVAATRAKELLVVPTCGDSVIEGWLELLVPALYPSREQRRRPLGSGPATPAFTGDSVLKRPIDAQLEAEHNVAPGEHQPERGEHRVVWWDPHVLDLHRPPVGGLTQQELLAADEESGRDEQGRLAYETWLTTGAALRAKASTPSWVSQSITLTAHQELAAAPANAFSVGAAGAPVTADAASAGLEVIDSGARRPGRPSGPRFGTLVHALLERASARADASELQGLASFVGRGIGATPEEASRAVEDTLLALEHPLWSEVRAAEARGEAYREWPVSLRREDGTLLEGVIDLVFRERTSEGRGRFVVVDFKTDVELSDLTAYGRQLGLYCEALSKVFGEPCRALLFRV